MSINKLTVGVALGVLLSNAGDLLHAQRPAPATQSATTAGKTTGQKTATPPQTSQQRAPQRKRWWSDEDSKKELKLTADQAKALDQIFTSSQDELSGYWDAMRREETERDRLISESKVEQWVVLRQIEKAETQRSNFNKLRLMTLYRMHRVLTPEQRTKLQQMQERDRRDPRRRP
jgi:Spy/CpxP family protein refolding chaperone